MADYTLTCDEGLLVLTGNDILTWLKRRVKVNPGGYFLTDGQDVIFLQARIFSVDSRSFTLSGKVAGLDVERLFTANQGTFALNGQSLDFKFAYKLPVDTGLFVLGGQDVDFLRVFEAEPGAGETGNENIILTGQSITFHLNREIKADKRTFLLYGQDVGLLAEGAPAQPCCDIPTSAIHHSSFTCPSNLGIIPNLQCAMDTQNTFNSGWDVVSFCDPESPYLPVNNWYIDPETTGINCSE